MVYLDSFWKISVFEEVPEYWLEKRLIKELIGIYA